MWRIMGMKPVETKLSLTPDTRLMSEYFAHVATKKEFVSGSQ